MEPKLKEIIQLVKELTLSKKLEWSFIQPNNTNILQTKIGTFIVRLTFTGPNVSFQLIENNRAVAAHAVSRSQDTEFNLFGLWQTAQRQILGIDEKLNQALDELKKIK